MKKILSLFLFIFSVNGYASPKVYILFINGINTTRAEAQENLLFLNIKSFVHSNMIHQDVLYNKTHGLIWSDIWDVMAQKAKEGKQLTLDDYTQIYMKTYRSIFLINSDDYLDLKDTIIEKYRDDSDFGGKNIKKVLEQFHKIVLDYKNSYVLLVSHSQGNLYANELYQHLVKKEHFPKDHLSLLGIANPGDHVEGNIQPIGFDSEWPAIQHYTADNDYVINALRVISVFHSPMGGNVHFRHCGDLYCHNLIQSYLSDREVKKKISKKISGYLAALKSNLIKQQQDIRLLFNLNTFSSGPPHISAELLQNKATLCSYDRDDRWIKCDEHKMNHIDFDNLDRDPYENYFIGFNDTLSPGEYWILGELSDTQDYKIHQLWVNLGGNITSASVLTYALGPYRPTWQPSRGTTKGTTFHFKNYGSLSAYPEFIFKGRPVEEKFILS